MRKGSSWDKIMKNIELMNDARGNKPKPFIQISTTTIDESEQLKKTFIDEIRGKCDYYNIGKTQMCHLNVDLMNISEERKNIFLRLQQNESLIHKHFAVCEEVYDKLSINWDGTVTACCADYIMVS